VRRYALVGGGDCVSRDGLWTGHGRGNP